MVFMPLLRYRDYYPLRPGVTRWKLHLISATVHMFGALCQIPVLILSVFVQPDQCFESWPSETWSITYTIFLSLVQFFIPVLFLGMIYWKICSELIRQS